MQELSGTGGVCRYDPDPQATVIEDDIDLVEAYLLVPEADFQPELQSPWLLRIELDKMMMLDKRLECIEVANKISGAYLGLVHVINSEDNADKLVLRLRLIDGVFRMGCCSNTQPSLRVLEVLLQCLGGSECKGV